MSQEQFKYSAFISYARKELKYAREIQLFLEKYHYPAKLIDSEHLPPHPKYLRPTFLDVTDLSTRHDEYLDDLEEALKQSRYLIVLCSEASSREKSLCHWEISTFLKYHSEKNIIPIALEQISEQSIPARLQNIVAHRNIPLWNTKKSILTQPTTNRASSVLSNASSTLMR